VNPSAVADHLAIPRGNGVDSRLRDEALAEGAAAATAAYLIHAKQIDVFVEVTLIRRVDRLCLSPVLGPDPSFDSRGNR